MNHFTGKYCILDVKPAFDSNIPAGSKPPSGINNDSVIWHPALQLFWSRNSLLSFRYGLCAPSVCSDQDLQVLAEYCKYRAILIVFVLLFPLVANRFLLILFKKTICTFVQLGSQHELNVLI